MSEAFLQMAGVFSQLELAMIRSRVRSGMENARAKGRQIGRPQVSKEDIPASFLRHYPAYKSKQLNVSELARVCDISRTTAYKYIGLLEAQNRSGLASAPLCLSIYFGKLRLFSLLLV